MSRQHAAPILVPSHGEARPLARAAPDWSEADIQALIQAHPACLPIAEVDPLFADPVPLCRELATAAGPIDNVFVTPTGLPVLVECKLWQNPQARREVVGQIIDYAKELSRWTASDLQREVSRRTGRTMLDLVRAAGHVVDEIAFNDAVSLNLRLGRVLLLIVGDGIRDDRRLDHPRRTRARAGVAARPHQRLHQRPASTRQSRGGRAGERLRR